MKQLLKFLLQLYVNVKKFCFIGTNIISLQKNSYYHVGSIREPDSQLLGPFRGPFFVHSEEKKRELLSYPDTKNPPAYWRVSVG